MAPEGKPFLGMTRLQRIVGRRAFSCAAHKTLAKQLAVERRVCAPLNAMLTRKE
jgi:hypothetical protein